jgi:thioredoxin-dependent peroxiredoxin
MTRLPAIVALVSAALLPLAPAQAALKVGQKAPVFATDAALAGNAFHFSLKDALKKGPVVLYFYPKAFTTGCTIEAHEFSDATADFKKLGATVIGMSGDNITDLKKFSVQDCRNNFAVGVASPAVISSYDVAMATHPGLTDRISYVIDKHGKIVFAYSSPDPSGHVTGTMDAVKKLTGKN